MKKKIALCVVLVMLAAIVFAVGGCAGKGAKTTVYFLNWGEYLDPELLEEFNNSHEDIEVKQSTATSNEDMYTIASTEGSSIDMVVISDYMVERMMQENLLAEIDLSGIENYQYVQKAAEARDFDADVKYSIPYMSGTLGIVYNTTLVDEEVNSWDILWDEKYAGNIMMYDSVRDSLAVALIKLGYDINTTDAAQVKKAGQLLIEQKPNVLAYGTDDIKDAMISGSVALAVDYAGAAMAAMMENSDISYVVPDEGSNIWVDNICILASSDKQEACYEFINFLCDPEVAARNSEYIGYTTPNEAATELVDDSLKALPGYIIDEDVQARCKYFKYLDEALEIYNEVWTNVKTASGN